MKSKRWLKAHRGYFYILPWLIGFLVFKLYPFGSSLIYSFSDYQLFDGISEWGIFNYLEIFTDRKIMGSFITTIKYGLMTVPLKLVFALFVAYILNFKLKGVKFFRTAYYIPSILGGSVAIAVLWKAIFKVDGIVNMILGAFGLEAFPRICMRRPAWMEPASGVSSSSSRCR